MDDLGGANKDILKRQLQILRKPPEQRSPEDLKAFAASLSKTKFFQELGDYERMEVCRYLKLEGAQKDTTIFKQGDPGDKFYLILCGSVGVFIKDVEAKDVESKTEATPTASPDASAPSSPRLPSRWAKVAKLMQRPEVESPPAAPEGQSESVVEQVADSLEKRQVKIEGLSEALEVDAPEGEPGPRSPVPRSESRLSTKSVGSEHGESDVVRENSLRAQIRSIGSMSAKKEEPLVKLKAKPKSLIRAILSRPLFVRGPKLLAVAQLSVGDAFGEVALQTDQPRAATVKAQRDAIFATLVREDYKAILHAQLKKRQEERQSFLRSIPLLEHLPNIPNLAALMQGRHFCRKGILIQVGTQVMHMYMVCEGSFSVRGGLKGKVKVSRTILSLVLPGCCYGLSHFLKGDKEHLRQVICESAQGLAYTLFAKDVAAHLSHKERLQVVKTAAAEEAFFRQRCLAVGQLAHTFQGHCVKRLWAPEKNLLDKIVEFRDVFSAKSIYSPEGRLRAIGSAFLDEAKCLDAQMYQEKIRTAKQSVQGHEESSEAPSREVSEPLLQTGWHMQDLAQQVFNACHDTSNPGALAADLQAAVEKGIRLARKNTTPLAPLVRRPWNPLEDEPQDYEELRPAPPEPAHTVSRELEPLATVFTPCCSSVVSEVEVLEPEVEAVDCNGLPLDFFSARLMELYSPCSAGSTRLTSRTSSRERSPWSLQLDSVFRSRPSTRPSSRHLDSRGSRN